jgi:HK97 family phage major capsid protein
MRTSTVSQPVSNIGMSNKETRRYSIFKLLNAIAQPGNREAQDNAAFEMAAHRAVEDRLGPSRNGGIYVPFDVQSRDLNVGTPSAGGYLVGTDNLGGSFVDLLRNRSLVTQLGAMPIMDLVGNVTIPRQVAAGSAYWLLNETTAITASQLTLGQLAFSPKTVGALTEVTRLLLMQSSPSAEALIMNDLASVLGLAIDAAAINGSGASGQPLGVLNTSGVGAVSGTSLGYAGVLELQTDVETSNVEAEQCGYLAAPLVAGKLMQRQRFANTDSPVWAGSVRKATMAGCRALSTNQMPAGTIAFGDWTQLLIASWGVLELKATDSHDSNFAAGITTIRAMVSVDIGIRNAGAFSVATSVT